MKVGAIALSDDTHSVGWDNRAMARKYLGLTPNLNMSCEARTVNMALTLKARYPNLHGAISTRSDEHAWPVAFCAVGEALMQRSVSMHMSMDRGSASKLSMTARKRGLRRSKGPMHLARVLKH